MNIGRLALCLCGLLALCAGARAQSTDAGMVTKVRGEVTYQSGAAAPKPVIAFMKLRGGDRIQLPPGATLQLVYFAGGLQETWSGPNAITVQPGASAPERAGARPETRKLPATVLQSLSKAPNVVHDIKNRQGMVFVRSAAMADKIRAMEEAYDALRAAAPEDDVTPELYLLATVYELRLFRDIPDVLQEIRRRQPDNPEVELLWQNYQKLMLEGEAGAR